MKPRRPRIRRPRENLWITLGPTPAACLQVLKDLGCWLAVGWLETTWKTVFPSYVSGDEQCMRKDKWFPAGLSILAWMRHRDSAFQVGRPAGLRLTRVSGPPCSRSTSSQTSLPSIPPRRVGCHPSISRRVLVDRRAEREAVRVAPPVDCPHAICGSGSSTNSWPRCLRSRPNTTSSRHCLPGHPCRA